MTTARSLATLVLALCLPAAAAAAAPRTAPAKTTSKAAAQPESKAPSGDPAGAREATVKAPEDDGMSLKGGQEGTVFRSLTVEGEDRIHVEFDRPALALDLDPTTAPGLTWGDAADVLDRTRPDLAAPMLATTAAERSPFVARPWLGEFRSGAVARFTPAFESVARWRLMIANAKGETVASFEGRGKPPRSLAWDGRGKDGQPVTPGLTYSYAFEAFDRAGNKRNFVGEGFAVGAYRLETPEGPTLVFAGDMLGGYAGLTRGRVAAGPAPPVLLEAASWLNQSGRLTQPLKITATARSAGQATALADAVTRGLTPLLLGDPARLRPITQVQPDAPEAGTVMIAAGR